MNILAAISVLTIRLAFMFTLFYLLAKAIIGAEWDEAQVWVLGLILLALDPGRES